MEVSAEKSKDVKKEVLKVLAFLDIFNYPPTAVEVWRFLGVRARLEEVIEALSALCHSETQTITGRENPGTEYGAESLENKNESQKFSGSAGRVARGGLVQERNGLYFLAVRDNLFEKRREFFHLAEKKSRIARRAARILAWIPGIKMIAACNNFYYRPESDIDFFIILKQNRLWLARALATAALHLSGLRRHGRKIANRICLSFYIAETGLNLENISLKPSDPYFYYWLAFLEPIYDSGIHKDFRAANGWLKNIFPNFFKNDPVDRKRVFDNFFTSSFKRASAVWFGGFLGDALEALFKKIQLKKMSARLKENKSAGVIVNDRMLKFHENDRRPEFADKLNSSLRHLYENHQ